MIRPGTIAQALDLLKRDRIVDEGDGWPRLTLEALERLATSRAGQSRHSYLDRVPYFAMSWRYPRGAVDGVRWFTPL